MSQAICSKSDISGLFVIAFTLASSTGVAHPRQAGKIFSSARIDSFRTEFLKLGYVEVKNVTFETRAAKLSYDRLPALADELVRLKVDAIVTPGARPLKLTVVPRELRAEESIEKAFAKLRTKDPADGLYVLGGA